MPRGRPHKEWTAERVRDMLLAAPNQTFSIHKLKALVHYKRDPQRWLDLLKDIASARNGTDLPGTLFTIERIDGVMSVAFKDRGQQ